MRIWILAGLLLVGALACATGSPAAPASEPAAPGTMADGDASAPVDGAPEGAAPGPPDAARTEIVVGFDADAVASFDDGIAADHWSLVVRVDGVITSSELLDAARPDALPHEVRITPAPAKLDGDVEIEVIGMYGAGYVVRRRATARFAPGEVRLLYVRAEVRCNRYGGSAPADCTKEGETCIGGACRSDAASELPAYRADWATHPPSACGAGTASTVLLGEGKTTLALRGDGDTVTPDCGTQGGHHLWIALQMKDVAQTGTIVTVSAQQPGGPSLPATAYPYTWSARGDGACELVGLRYQLDGSVAMSALYGKPLDVRVDLADESGRTTTVTRHVVVAASSVGPYCF